MTDESSRSIDESDRPTDESVSRRRLLGSIGTFAALTGTPGAIVSGDAEGASARCRDPTETVASPRPGPDALYESRPSAPQLENADGWEADPIMVSGTDAYVDGEYLYQDYVYDDYGANTTDAPLPPNPQPSDESTYGENGLMTGDVVYPTDEGTYRHNAANLLEFRVRRVDDGVRYRITLQTMVEPDVAGVFVGIDEDPDESAESTGIGYGVGDVGIDVDHEVVTWGTGAELDGGTIESSVDVRRNQIEVTVPLDPGEETWRHYVAVGLFDPEERAFVQVRESPDEEAPGGSHGSNPPPFFNVGFRFDEPMGAPNLDEETIEEQLEEGTETGSRGLGYGHFRDHAQALALEERDVSDLHADVDFGALAAETTEYRVPESGFLDRLYVSREDLGRGVDAEADVTLNRIQPYALYVPEGVDGEKTPLHLHLHSLGSTHNEYGVLTSNLLREFGEERGAIVLTPFARGPSGWYQDEAELDVFEAWRDVRTRYAVDGDRATLGGYSMGGFGTYRLSSLYPDLFGRSFAVSGPPDEEYFGGPTDGVAGGPQNALRVTDNLRNLPIRMWTGSNDRLVPVAGPYNYHRDLRDHGYRHELGIFPGYDHFTFTLRDEWGPAREFLEGATVERSPAQVTYRAAPEMDAEEFDLIHDEAYWVSGIGVADDAADGLVDVRSLAFGEAPPVTVDYEREGTEPAAHTKHGTSWEGSLDQPVAENALELELDGATAVTLWIDEAELDATEPIALAVDATHEATVVLESEYGRAELTVPAGTSEREVLVCGDPSGS